MFGIGFSEMLLIGVIVLIAVGPKRLPQLMKTVGHGVREIRRASNELRRTAGIDDMMREMDVRQALREPPRAAPVRRALTDEELEREQPSMGVDLAEATHLAEVGQPVMAGRHGASERSPDEA